MGNSLSATPTDQVALRIIFISETSNLASNAKLFEDFIISINDYDNFNDLNILEDFLKKSLSSSLKLNLWNIIDNKSREIRLELPIPVKRNTNDNLEDILGIKFRREQLSNSLSKIIRITDVQSNSAAKYAGIISMSDFILTSLSFDYQDCDGFASAISNL